MPVECIEPEEDRAAKEALVDELISLWAALGLVVLIEESVQT